MAGHSKWANIQHRKCRQDAVRSKLFSKLSKEITVAAKIGESDPEKNPRLRLAIREAKSNSVPKAVKKKLKILCYDCKFSSKGIKLNRKIQVLI